MAFVMLALLPTKSRISSSRCGSVICRALSLPVLTRNGSKYGIVNDRPLNRCAYQRRNPLRIDILRKREGEVTDDYFINRFGAVMKHELFLQISRLNLPLFTFPVKYPNVQTANRANRQLMVLNKLLPVILPSQWLRFRTKYHSGAAFPASFWPLPHAKSDHICTTARPDTNGGSNAATDQA